MSTAVRQPTQFSATASNGPIAHSLTHINSHLEDEIRRGPQRDLFNPDDMVTYKEDAANNFARGYFSVGRKLLDAVMNRIREKVEACPSLQVN